MARTGRNFWLWLVISVFLTSIPATIVLMYDQMRRLSPRRVARGGAAPIRCTHCGGVIEPAEADEPDGVALCPHCHLPIDEATVG